jgi:polyferredoxin
MAVACGPASPSSATSRRSVAGPGVGDATWAGALGDLLVLFYGFATYGNAGFMREQVCKYMCPYARFQSAMFDKDTLIITYDAASAASRAARARKKADPKAELGLGDCIDCNLCVQVCPTGIDIRKGLQYECIGCAACVDVLRRRDGQDGLTHPIRFEIESMHAPGHLTEKSMFMVPR